MDKAIFLPECTSSELITVIAEAFCVLEERLGSEYVCQLLVSMERWRRVMSDVVWVEK